MPLTQSLLTIENINHVCQHIQAGTLHTAPRTSLNLLSEVQLLSFQLPQITDMPQPMSTLVQRWLVWDSVQVLTEVLLGQAANSSRNTIDSILNRDVTPTGYPENLCELHEAVCLWLNAPTLSNLILLDTYTNPTWCWSLVSAIKATTLGDVQRHCLGFLLGLSQAGVQNAAATRHRLSQADMRMRFYAYYADHLPALPVCGLADAVGNLQDQSPNDIFGLILHNTDPSTSTDRELEEVLTQAAMRVSDTDAQEEYPEGFTVRERAVPNTVTEAMSPQLTPACGVNILVAHAQKYNDGEDVVVINTLGRFRAAISHTNISEAPLPTPENSADVVTSQGVEEAGLP